MLAALFQMLSRLRGFFLRSRGEQDFEEELRSHLTFAVEEKMRAGLSRAEAERAARLELGGLTQLREARRELSGLPALDTLGLDLRLGLRMLKKHLGLTVIGGLALTVAITISVLVFAFFDVIFGGSLPLEDGDRVIAIELWDVHTNTARRIALRDVQRWSQSLLLEDLGAFQTVERNLSLGTAATESRRTPHELVRVAQMTSSGFRLAGGKPLRGRTLVEADADPGAPPVVVLGEGALERWFSDSADVLGSRIRLGATLFTVVGIMPEEFSFPVNHQFWTALSLDSDRLLGVREESAVFGRLRAGATPAVAEAELASIGLTADVLQRPPERGEHPWLEQRADEASELRARVQSYPLAMVSPGDPEQMRWVLRLVFLLGALLLAPPSANVAILVYARTMARQEEFAARHALGASRGRIILQLSLEMLVLSLLSAAVALGVTAFALRWVGLSIERESAGGAPFWMSFQLGWSTVGFALFLSVVAALIAGLLPALKAMGQRQLSGGIRTLGSRSGLRLGATWTLLVILQVGVCLGALPLAAELTWGTMRNGVLGPGLPAEKILTARLSFDRDLDDGGSLAESSVERSTRDSLRLAFLDRVKEEAGASSVSYGTLPGDGGWMVASPAPSGSEGAPEDAGRKQELPWRLVRTNAVDGNFFELYGLELLSGRGFEAADEVPGARSVLIDRALADKLFVDGAALGETVRYRTPGRPSEDQVWTPPFRVVGIVASRSVESEQRAIYHPLLSSRDQSDGSHALQLSILTTTDPDALGLRLRELAAEISPALRVDEVRRLDAIYRDRQGGNNAGVVVIVAVMSSIVLLSAGGLYALLSFTIDQRRREIGVRSALGAPPHRLIASVFRKAAFRVGAGAGAGLMLALAFDRIVPAERLGGWEIPGVIPAALLLMVGVGVLAGVGPARRGLRVDALEELRES